MKKTLMKFFVIALTLVMVFALAGCGGSGNSGDSGNPGNSADANEKLVALSEAFLNLDTVKGFLEYDGYVAEANVEGDTLKVAMGLSDSVTETSFTLDGDILTMDGGMTADQIYTAICMATAKAVMDGTDETTATAALTHNSALDMTLEDNGILLDVDGEVFQMDLSKPATLMDMSDVYITLEDLGERDEDFTSYMGHVGLVGYYMNISDTSDTIICVAEPGELTERSYKSLITLVEFVYGKDAADEFAANYPVIGEASFDNYTVTLNPDSEQAAVFDEGYEVLQLVVAAE